MNTYIFTVQKFCPQNCVVFYRCVLTAAQMNFCK